MKWKKFLALLLVLMLAFSLVACGDPKGNDGEESVTEVDFAKALSVYKELQKGILTEDIIKDACPWEILDHKADAGKRTVDDLISSMVSGNEELQRIYTSWDFQYPTDVTIQVDSMEKMKAEDLEELNNSYKEEGYTFKIAEGYEITCTMESKYTGENSRGEDSTKVLLTMVKVDDVWYCAENWYILKCSWSGMVVC